MITFFGQKFDGVQNLKKNYVNRNSGCAINIKNSLTQSRRLDLEQTNYHLMIIDIDLKQNYRPINVCHGKVPKVVKGCYTKWVA